MTSGNAGFLSQLLFGQSERVHTAMDSEGDGGLTKGASEKPERAGLSRSPKGSGGGRPR